MNTATFKTAMTDNLEILSSDELAATAGGLAVPPPNQNDAGGQWLRTQKTDLINTNLRERATVNDLKKHHWVSAAKDGVAAVVDASKGVVDAINPFKIF
jgi:hypothetical protein